MTISEKIILFILAGSVLANLAYVVFNRQMAPYTFRWDLFRWISAYQLFAVTPGHLQLFYRDRLEDGSVTDWTEIPLSAEPRWYHIFFFHNKFVAESLLSFVDDLVRMQTAGVKPEGMTESFEYRTVLKMVRRFPFGGNSNARQFRIRDGGGYVSERPAKKLYTSEFHDR